MEENTVSGDGKIISVDAFFLIRVQYSEHGEYMTFVVVDWVIER